MSGPLEGIKVLDLTRVLAGPYCTMILGDLGADIIKVEAPGGSDDTRKWGPPYTRSGLSAYYLCANRNKRAITLNLKSEEGKIILKRLVKTSDVVIHNFKNGTMEKWGLGYNVLSKINPQIVYCSITGFGNSGPYKELPGYDYIIQAMSGLMSITGAQESGPVKVGVAISDIVSGLYATIGIISSLYKRQMTHKGANIDISLLDSQISTLINVASNYLTSGDVPGLLGNEHPNIVPYQTFHTADKQIVIAVGNDLQFKKFCEATGLDHIIQDERFKTNSGRVKHRKELINIISSRLKSRRAEKWLSILRDKGVPCGSINNLKEVFEDPQVQERNMIIEVRHPEDGLLKLVGSPLKISGQSIILRHHPPKIGEHNKEVLNEIGFTLEEIDRLRKKGIL